ncbi:hypothetical protein J0X15_08295 [Roseibium sp. CAU 1637]|uniref:DUF1254 domain-containing protein n=1 Tax=Roseibium limicola TaxID=2816037 RepID=A0A939J6K2_9HYPH|nr:hypothetical protein [Roseibium limicola]MBO0345217.1 hypothetical protein [Roseibium limicola]
MSIHLPSRLRWGAAFVATLSLAVVVHILVVLAIPREVTHSAYTDAARFGPDRQFNLLPAVEAGAEPLPGLDPAMKHAACRYQLDDGPVLFTAAVPVPFWSIGLFNATGEVVYSLNNRTAGSDILSLLLITPQQLSILRENPPEDLDKLIVIETAATQGFALLRAFSPSPAKDLEVDLAMKTAFCGRFE